MEYLMAIALLCQFSISAGTSNKKEVLACQQEYVHCINTQSGEQADRLEKCILKRKL